MAYKHYVGATLLSIGVGYAAYRLGVRVDDAIMLSGALFGGVLSNTSPVRKAFNHVHRAAVNAALGRTPQSGTSLDQWLD